MDWSDPRALDCFGEREPTEPWSWQGPARAVTGRTWGGCLEVIEEILTAGRFPFGPDVLDGGVLLIETSEELLPARNVGWIVRALGERGILGAVGAVLLARALVSDFTRLPPAAERARLRAEQRDVVAGLIARYNPEAVVCAGIPFGHTPAMDPPARRHDHRRRRRAPDYRRLLITGQARSRTRYAPPLITEGDDPFEACMKPLPNRRLRNSGPIGALKAQIAVMLVLLTRPTAPAPGPHYGRGLREDLPAYQLLICRDQGVLIRSRIANPESSMLKL